MSEEMNRVSHALCAPDYALLVPSLPARGFFLLSESSTVLRAFSTRWTTPDSRAAKHKRPRHDACNHRALLISRATLRTSHATCRSFASPKRRRRLFLLRGARDQRNERGEEQTRWCWWPRRDLSSHRQVHRTGYPRRRRRTALPYPAHHRSRIQGGARRCSALAASRYPGPRLPPLRVGCCRTTLLPRLRRASKRTFALVGDRPTLLGSAGHHRTRDGPRRVRTRRVSATCCSFCSSKKTISHRSAGPLDELHRAADDSTPSRST